MQPICSAKLFLAFKAKVIAFFFFPSMRFMHIYDNFPLSSQIPSFLQNQSLLIRTAKSHEVARRPPMGGAFLLPSDIWIALPCNIPGIWELDIPYGIGRVGHELKWWRTQHKCSLWPNYSHSQCRGRTGEAGKDTAVGERKWDTGVSPG